MNEQLNVGKWWADMLRRSTPLTPNTGYAFGDFVSASQSNIPSFTDQQIEAFENALNALIDSLAASNEAHVAVKVDYHPDETLYRAAAIAEINIDGIFPPKTLMAIEGDVVRVKVGYRAEWHYYRYAPESVG